MNALHFSTLSLILAGPTLAQQTTPCPGCDNTSEPPLVSTEIFPSHSGPGEPQPLELDVVLTRRNGFCERFDFSGPCEQKFGCKTHLSLTVHENGWIPWVPDPNGTPPQSEEWPDAIVRLRWSGWTCNEPHLQGQVDLTEMGGFEELYSGELKADCGHECHYAFTIDGRAYTDATPGKQQLDALLWNLSGLLNCSACVE